MNRKTLVAALAAVAVAGGLSGCVTSTGPIYHTDDPYAFLGRAGMGGNIPVMILGDPPYPGRQVAVEAEILAALNRKFPSFGKAFRVVPPAAGTSSRLVVLFTAEGARPLAAAICADASRPGLTAPQGSQLYMGVVYCADGPASEAWAWGPKPASPDSDEFKKTVDTVISEALPRELIPSRRNDGQIPPQS